MVQDETNESPSPTKPPKGLEVLDEEGDDESATDTFDERYLDSINESVKTLSPEKIRVRDQTIIDEPIKVGMGGLNMSIFSSSNDVLSVMRAKNGVKLVSNKQELGSGRFINDNPSKMSLSKYHEIAEANKSLANIAIGADNNHI